RHLACQELGIEAPTKAWRNPDGSETAFAHVWATNALRRHLTAPQKLAILAKAHPEDWEKVGTGKPGPTVTIPGTVTTEIGPTERLAEKAGLSPITVRKVKALEREARDLFDRTVSGELTFKEADRERLYRQVQRETLTREEHREKQDMEWETHFVK